MLSTIALFALGVIFPVTAQVARDPGVAGPPIELVHLYNDEFPTGKLVLFLCYSVPTLSAFVLYLN